MSTSWSEAPERRRVNGDILLWSEARERGHGFAMAVDSDGYEYACGLDEREWREGDVLLREWTMHGRRERFAMDRQTKQWSTVSAAATQTPEEEPEAGKDRTRHLAWWRKFKRDWKSNGNVLFHGPPGTGKTFAADLALQFVGHKGVDTERLKWARFAAGAAEDRFADDDARREWRELRERCAAVPFLLVDDFAAAKPTPSVQDAWLALLDARIEAELPTLITSNADEAALSVAGWDARVMSRLALWESVTMGTRDRRRK